MTNMPRNSEMQLTRPAPAGNRAFAADLGVRRGPCPMATSSGRTAWFEQAEVLRPPDNDDAILRWNACARVLMHNPQLGPRSEERDMPLALE
jgi:hypothetical protein